MEVPVQRVRVFDVVWLLAWGVASSVWCVSAAAQLSATSDEPVYVVAGLEHWRTGSYQPLIRLGTMPLPVDMQTLPLYLYERWKGIPLDPSADMNRVLPWVRATTLLSWWVLLLYGWRAGTQLGGIWAGRLAVALLACEPTLLAHAGLATTDITLSACLLAVVYHFRTRHEHGWFLRRIVPAIWFAALLLAKASGPVFGVLCLVMVEAERLAWTSPATPFPGESWAGRLRRWSIHLRPGAVDLILVLCLGTVLALLYCNSAYLAFWYQFRRNTGYPQATGAYLLGHWYANNIWYYFPVTLSIKLSLPLLALPVLLAFVRVRSLTNWACLATAALVVFSLACRVQIGVRLVLPLVGLWIVGLAGALVQTYEAWGPGLRRRILAGGVGACVVWTAVAALTVWPQGLCYANPLWGGTPRAYRLVSDSNYDWGQGLKELKRWQRKRGLATLDVWAVGPQASLRTLPMRPMCMDALPIKGPADVVAQVRGHYLAVSTTALYGFASDTPAGRYLRRCKPVDRTSTFLIYDFTQTTGGGSAESPTPPTAHAGARPSASRIERQ